MNPMFNRLEANAPQNQAYDLSKKKPNTSSPGARMSSQDFRPYQSASSAYAGGASTSGGFKSGLLYHPASLSSSYASSTAYSPYATSSKPSMPFTIIPSENVSFKSPSHASASSSPASSTTYTASSIPTPNNQVPPPSNLSSSSSSSNATKYCPLPKKNYLLRNNLSSSSSSSNVGNNAPSASSSSTGKYRIPNDSSTTPDRLIYHSRRLMPPPQPAMSSVPTISMPSNHHNIHVTHGPLAFPRDAKPSHSVRIDKTKCVYLNTTSKEDVGAARLLKNTTIVGSRPANVLIDKTAYPNEFHIKGKPTYEVQMVINTPNTFVSCFQTKPDPAKYPENRIQYCHVIKKENNKVTEEKSRYFQKNNELTCAAHRFTDRIVKTTAVDPSKPSTSTKK